MSLVRLFRLTRREYFADFLITPPLTLGLAILAIDRGVGPIWLLGVAAGLIAWTLYEYALHRWVLHGWPFAKLHALHHRDQRDFIAVHPAITVALYAGSWMAFGLGNSGFMIGFSVGYIAYATLHTAYHHAPSRVRLLGKRRHALHHVFHRVNFGVTTRTWDRIFRTEYVHKGM